jgi:hypothetical protein
VKGPLSVLAIASFLNVASAATPMFQVPKGALEAEHITLQPGVAWQDHFFLKEKYPGSSALEHYSRAFFDWRSCFWAKRDWESILDASSGSVRQLHRRVRFWVSPTNREWVMVTLQYGSPMGSGGGLADDRQYVVVAIRRSNNAIGELTEFDAKCDEAPNKSLESSRGQ